MLIRGILREARRNIATGTTRAALLATLLCLCSVGSTAADLAAVRQISASAERYVDAGASVLTLTAAGRISGRACASLASLPGVRAAGALRTTSTTLTASVLPSSPLPRIEVTDGILSILRAERRAGTGILLSDEAVAALGAGPGDALATSAREVPIVGRYPYPADGREPGLGYSALVPVPPDRPFDQCWADVWPPSPATAAVLRTTLLPGGPGDDNAEAAQLNGTLGADFDGSERFAQRITRWAPALAFCCAVGLGYAGIRRRRLELASALHSGVARRSLAAMLGLELLSWLVPPVILTAATIAVFAAGSTDAAALALLGARAAVATVVGATAGAAVGLATTRERHLFRYFKDR